MKTQTKPKSKGSETTIFSFLTGILGKNYPQKLVRKNEFPKTSTTPSLLLALREE